MPPLPYPRFPPDSSISTKDGETVTILRRPHLVPPSSLRPYPPPSHPSSWISCRSWQQALAWTVWTPR